MMDGRSPATLVSLLRKRACASPDALAVRYLDDRAETAEELSYGELDRRARALAVRLRRTAPQAERALLLYHPGPAFLPAFMACAYAGITAVPVYPPRNAQHMARLETILADTDTDLLLTTRDFEERIAIWLTGLAVADRMTLLATDTPEQDLADTWLPPGIDAAAIALLQYTSGSTSAPKGVLVSHGNLLCNIQGMLANFGTQPPTGSVSWMPHFHDMGLIEGLLMPLYAGYPVTVLPPAAFLQRPVRWLWAIARSGASHTSGPNFAYDLCTDRISDADMEGVDLSCWRTGMCAAEPVRPDTLRRFRQRFARYGLPDNVPAAGYGLAEATLYVALPRLAGPTTVLPVDAEAFAAGRVVAVAAEAPGAKELVGVGKPGWPVAIAEPDSRRTLPADTVGEIWIGGETPAQGYWRRPEATAETFAAHLSDSGNGPFLRTGDLGFLRPDGELFVTGRLKDVIIIDGANHYPHDIELSVAQADAAFRPNGGAAFTIEQDGHERLVVVQEVERTQRHSIDADALFAKAARVVADEHGLTLERLVLILPGALPRTSSGKVRHGHCRDLLAAGELAALADIRRPTAAPPRATPTSDGLRRWLIERVAARLGLPPERIDPTRPLAEYGLGSRDAIGLSGEVEEHLGRPVPATLAYDHPTIDALAAHLCGSPVAASAIGHPLAADEPIAIIGMACRFPGAASPQAFWDLLTSGNDAIRDCPDERIALCGAAPARRGGFIDGVEMFDPAFFGISAREAAAIDPQQRLLLEVAWEALEAAGQPVAVLAGQPVGVYIGIATQDYGHLALGGAEATVYQLTGTAQSVAANRVSYALGLEGPSMAIDTACSSSLVAIHTACQSLRAGEASLALAGGVNIMLSAELTRRLEIGGMMAADGRCKTFDADADGYVRGEGCGVVVLKPLAAALADNDPVLAVIRGSAVNQDGRSNGLTAPNRVAQERLIRAALAHAGAAPDEIGFVETHGTGTPLGDPIEVGALAAVLGQGRADRTPCRLGAVKTMIGHLEAAAGIAGLIKAVLVLRHGEIPANCNLANINPELRLGTTLALPNRAEPWPAGPRPRLCGVSSFGFGGTNAHVVLAEAPRREPAEPATARPMLLPVSAATTGELARRLRDLAALPADASLLDLAETLGPRRSALACRAAIVADSPAQARNLFVRVADEVKTRSNPLVRLPRVAFVFCGQGTQWAGMARDLLDDEPVFRAEMERLEPQLHAACGWSVLDMLRHPDEARLTRTQFIQPVLFAVQTALAALWRSWGVVAEAAIGHSMGEVTAALWAGVVDEATAVRIIATRAAAMADAGGDGLMAGIREPADRVRERLAGKPEYDGIGIAADNGLASTVVSGPATAVRRLLAEVAAEGATWIEFPGDTAFHNPAMAPSAARLDHGLTGIAMNMPSHLLLSTVSGRPWQSADCESGYWGRNVVQPVRFRDAAEHLLAEGFTHFIEIGPHPALQSQLSDMLGATGRCGCVVGSLRRDLPARATLLASAGQLFESGLSPDWRALQGAPGRVVTMPAYPWRRSRHWLDAPAAQPAATPQEPWTMALEQARRQSHQGPLDLNVGRYGQCWDTLDRFAKAAIGRALTKLGDASVAERHADVVARWRGTEATAADYPAALERMRAELADLGFLAEYMERCAELLPAVLRGEVSPLETLFPGASLETANALYHQWAVPRYFNGIAAAMLAAWQAAQPAGRILEVLEIGAGTGGLTRALLPVLKRETTRYHFTDVSDFFFAHARRWLAEQGQVWPEVRLSLFDAEEPPENQGFAPASTDVVVAANALHATADLDATLAHVSRLLRPGGLLMLYEVTHHFGWFDISIGLIEGWHRFRDGLREDGPLLSPDGWRALFTRHGFTLTEALPEAGSAAAVLGQHILVARKDGNAVNAAATPARPFTLQWRDRPPMPAGSLAGTWLILADNPVGSALTHRLAAAGARPIETDAAEIGAALEREGGSVRAIIDLRAFAPTKPAWADAAALATATHGLMRQLATRPHHPPVILAFPTTPPGALIGGLGRVAHKELTGGTLRLVGIHSGDVVDALNSELACPDAGEEVRWHDGHRQVARLAPASWPAKVEPLHPDASYLVTGAMGVLGRQVVRHLIERGARHLVVLGRHAPDHTTAAEWAAARIAGCRIAEIVGDVTDPALLDSVFARFDADGEPPLRGIVHAAGSLEVRRLAQLEPVGLAAALSAKVAGALLLHEHTQCRPLDFFVLFSSFAGWIAPDGHAAYAAANASLDALAEHRRALGLPATSIAWGVWEDAGRAARGVVDSVARQGVARIAFADGLQAFDRLAQGPFASVAVLAGDPLDLGHYDPALAALPLFADLLAERSATPVGDGSPNTAPGSMRARILAADPEARADALIGFLAQALAETLRMAVSDVALEVPLLSLGLDSLMAIDLKSRIERELGIALPVVRLLGAAGLRDLAGQILGLMAATIPVETVDSDEWEELTL